MSAPKGKVVKVSSLKAKTSAKAKTLSEAEQSLEFIEGIKRRWMATVDAIVDPLMLVEKDHRVIQANRALATISTKDIKKVVGSKCHKMFAGRDTPCPGCKLGESIMTESTQTFELNDINGRYYEVTAQPIFDGNGDVEGSLHIYRDRTLAKQLQNQLIQTEKLASIGLLAGGIAHELNNPLAGILLFSQMLLRTVKKESEYYQDVEEIENAAKRCKAIVDSLLDFARQQPAAQLLENKEVVNILDALSAALRFSTVGGKRNKHEIVEKYDTSLDIKALGNKNKIVQVFLNLIQNSLQAMPKAGKLTLRSFLSDDKLWNVIEIEDSGVGIPAAHLKKIFDPFFTSKAEGEGTGLGLSICHGIIEELGGRIEVRSKVRKGTCFSIFFPIPEALREVG
ncbi:MAG: PAS domain-containing protein [Chitinophagaceae bacterium]|nr:PAS domain-containing protein [Oligoflexus sp.]